jgi:hypothetical protein
MDDKRSLEGSDFDDGGFGTESFTSATKQQKTAETDLGDMELPRTKLVILRFSSTGQEVAGRIVSRESFGILVKATEDGLAPVVRTEDRFWTKYCGVLQPLSRTPVVEVIHQVKTK